jgi:release factor glutamine methyltransferase
VATLREVLADAGARLSRAGVADAEREAAWLLAHVMGCSAGSLRLRGAETITPEQQQAFGDLVERRAAREPIQYILGTEEFMGMTFNVTPAVLIPRLDTEVLVREVAALLSGPVRLADIGTGSGAIAVGLAALLPRATVTAVDISAEALAVARTNAAANGVADRILFRQGDLLAPLAGERFDAIISNPPYIAEDDWAGLLPEVQQWEPKGALTPGDDALRFYRRLAAESPSLLKPGGLLAVEVGIGQAAAVAALFAVAGFRVTVHRDTGAVDRVVIGRLCD